MLAWSRHPEMVAAWTLALVLVGAVSLAPWEKLRAAHPVGVVEVTQQRFDVRFPGGAHDRAAEARHDSDLHDLTFGPEGP
ncbi:MAG TPA: hypothetical protein VHM01_01320 [Alphaproteobacteria bacterium]|nr:hypothetical protein [Alphaproteobacteria bacterium]